MNTFFVALAQETPPPQDNSYIIVIVLGVAFLLLVVPLFVCLIIKCRSRAMQRKRLMQLRQVRWGSGQNQTDNLGFERLHSLSVPHRLKSESMLPLRGEICSICLDQGCDSQLGCSHAFHL